MNKQSAGQYLIAMAPLSGVFVILLAIIMRGIPSLSVNESILLNIHFLGHLAILPGVYLERQYLPSKGYRPAWYYYLSPFLGFLTDIIAVYYLWRKHNFDYSAILEEQEKFTY